MALKRKQASPELAPYIEDDITIDEPVHQTFVSRTQRREQRSDLESHYTASKEQKRTVQHNAIPAHYLSRFRVKLGHNHSPESRKSVRQQQSLRTTLRSEHIRAPSSEQMSALDLEHHAKSPPAASEVERPTEAHDDDLRPAEPSHGRVMQSQSPARQHGQALQTEEQQSAPTIADDQAEMLRRMIDASSKWSPLVKAKLKSMRDFAREMNNAARRPAATQIVLPPIQHDLNTCLQIDFLAALKVLAADLELKEPDSVTYSDGVGLVIERDRNDRSSYFDQSDVVCLDWSRPCLLEQLAVHKLGGRKILGRSLLQIECIMQAHSRRKSVVDGVPSVGFRPDLREAVSELSQSDAARIINTEWERAQQTGQLEVQERQMKLLRKSGNT
ncbi:hypothetical protein AMS68_003589 [Peltaster fructicola]|uniref:Uncharacterized protein n=1 Tax=Peltaster fructicola TaxID=286661 RepID=A0A6H0XTH0_9PEZI|nr:hypothetical protein AMS68_003589 [Peltaster fructicola]